MSDNIQHGEVWIVEHQFDGGHMSCIAYASTVEKAKKLANEHYGETITWLSGWDSEQASMGRHFYSIYQELVDVHTRWGHKNQPAKNW